MSKVYNFCKTEDRANVNDELKKSRIFCPYVNINPRMLNNSKTMIQRTIQLVKQLLYLEQIFRNRIISRKVSIN